MTNCFPISFFVPKKVDFLPPVKALAPSSLILRYTEQREVCAIAPGELNFFDREVIPRFFVVLIALASLVNAVGNLILCGAYYLSYTVHRPLAEEKTSAALFDRVQENFSQTISDLALGSSLFYGLLWPHEILEAAFFDDAEECPIESSSDSSADSSFSDSPLSVNSEEDPNSVATLPPPSPVLSVQVIEITLVATEAVRSASPIVDPMPAASVPVQEEEFDPLGGKFKVRVIPSRNSISAPSTPTSHSIQTPTSSISVSPAKVAAELPSQAKPAVIVATPAAVAKPPIDPYSTLQAPTAKQKDAIVKMLTTINETNAVLLARKKNYLRERQAEIKTLHTLKFLETILMDTNPDKKKNLKECLLSIKKNSFLKWGGFLNGDPMTRDPYDGNVGALKKANEQGQLKQYLPGFYKAVGLDVGRAEAFVTAGKWDLWFDLLLAKGE